MKGRDDDGVAVREVQVRARQENESLDQWREGDHAVGAAKGGRWCRCFDSSRGPVDSWRRGSALAAMHRSCPTDANLNVR